MSTAIIAAFSISATFFIGMLVLVNQWQRELRKEIDDLKRELEEMKQKE